MVSLANPVHRQHLLELGLLPNAKIDCHEITLSEIKRAYHEKIRSTHPDKTNASDGSGFIRVTDAYKELRAIVSRESSSLASGDSRSRNSTGSTIIAPKRSRYEYNIVVPSSRVANSVKRNQAMRSGTGAGCPGNFASMDASSLPSSYRIKIKQMEPQTHQVNVPLVNEDYCSGVIDMPVSFSVPCETGVNVVLNSVWSLPPGLPVNYTFDATFCFRVQSTSSHENLFWCGVPDICMNDSQITHTVAFSPMASSSSPSDCNSAIIIKDCAFSPNLVESLKKQHDFALIEPGKSKIVIRSVRNYIVRVIFTLTKMVIHQDAKEEKDEIVATTSSSRGNLVHRCESTGDMHIHLHLTVAQTILGYDLNLPELFCGSPLNVNSGGIVLTKEEKIVTFSNLGLPIYDREVLKNRRLCEFAELNALKQWKIKPFSYHSRSTLVIHIHPAQYRGLQEDTDPSSLRLLQQLLNQNIKSIS
jgi:hypothetical protein